MSNSAPSTSSYCYCDLWNKSPELLEKQGVPRGYCGLCEVCGKPGHLQHFPGGIPYSGAWCAKHYRRLLYFDPRGTIGCPLWATIMLVLFGLLMAAMVKR